MVLVLLEDTAGVFLMFYVLGKGRNSIANSSMDDGFTSSSFCQVRFALHI